MTHLVELIYNAYISDLNLFISLISNTIEPTGSRNHVYKETPALPRLSLQKFTHVYCFSYILAIQLFSLYYYSFQA